MGKKKRVRRISVTSSLEGNLELHFLELIQSMYSDREAMSFPDNPKKGGNPDVIISYAISKKDCCDRCFAWIDEDVEISDEIKHRLMDCWMVSDKDVFMQTDIKDLQRLFNPNNRKPVLIVSSPVCTDGFILRVLGNQGANIIFDPAQRKVQIDGVKNALKGLRAGTDIGAFFTQNITKEMLEDKRREIPELDILISLVTK